MSCCITVLTRGYQDTNKYSDLIKRNKSIQEHLNNKNIDILIFHEGDITYTQQIYIQNQTPLLKIIFVNILSHAFKESKKYIQFSKETEGYSLGYRHMCDFWFVSFWSFVKEYDYLLRIDEDCVINTNIDIIFYKLRDLKTGIAFPMHIGIHRRWHCWKSGTHNWNRFARFIK